MLQMLSKIPFKLGASMLGLALIAAVFNTQRAEAEVQGYLAQFADCQLSITPQSGQALVLSDSCQVVGVDSPLMQAATVTSTDNLPRMVQVEAVGNGVKAIYSAGGTGSRGIPLQGAYAKFYDDTIFCMGGTDTALTEVRLCYDVRSKISWESLN
jgi:hypothetical protein